MKTKTDKKAYENLESKKMKENKGISCIVGLHDSTIKLIATIKLIDFSLSQIS